MTPSNLLAPSNAVPIDSLGLPAGLPERDLPWETLSAMIQGRSSIDLTLMPSITRTEAQELVYNYGFDLDHPEDKAEMEGYFAEAVRFIEHRFLTPSVDWAANNEPLPPTDRVPASVASHCNVIELIMAASNPEHPQRPWACALLKVIHTLVYIRNSPLYKYHAQAGETILGRFRDVIQSQPDGSIMMQGKEGRQLPLFAFEAKHYKPRESILIKLLCKKENVAENVWDLVGVRLVTFHPAQAILAVDILREQKVILFPNVVPSRSRNTLIDFDHFRQMYEDQLAQVNAGKLDKASLNALFETDAFLLPNETHSAQNPLSSPKYRSLHITCRQLLRIPSATGSGADNRFAFPYEVQVLDKANYLDSKVGHGAHTNYKLRQLFAARTRVLGKLLST